MPYYQFGCGISKMVGSKEQHPHGKRFYFDNPMSISLSKIVHDFRKNNGSKIEVRKNYFKEIIKSKKSLIFDIDNRL